MHDGALPTAPLTVRMAAAVIRRLPAGRYWSAGQISHWMPQKFSMQMPIDTGGFTYRCDLRDAISREVCFMGQYEPQETALIRAMLGSGMTFVDVGANWGYFTLLAAHLVGSAGRVISLDADPRVFGVLEDNITRNHLTQVTVEQVAAAREPGWVTLKGYIEAEGNFGVSRIIINPTPKENVFQVRSDSLERILDSHEVNSVDLMKMDIEGGEAFALLGMGDLLAKGRVRRLLLELHPTQINENGSSVMDVIDILRKSGYSCLAIDHSPTVTRDWAYGRTKCIAKLMRSFDSGDQLDEWPHQLWLAPGVRQV